jgi:hypothetical protein
LPSPHRGQRTQGRSQEHGRIAAAVAEVSAVVSRRQLGLNPYRLHDRQRQPAFLLFPSCGGQPEPETDRHVGSRDRKDRTLWLIGTLTPTPPQSTARKRAASVHWRRLSPRQHCGRPCWTRRQPMTSWPPDRHGVRTTERPIRLAPDPERDRGAAGETAGREGALTPVTETRPAAQTPQERSRQ